MDTQSKLKMNDTIRAISELDVPLNNNLYEICEKIYDNLFFEFKPGAINNSLRLLLSTVHRQSCFLASVQNKNLTIVYESLLNTSPPLDFEKQITAEKINRLLDSPAPQTIQINHENYSAFPILSKNGLKSILFIEGSNFSDEEILNITYLLKPISRYLAAAHHFSNNNHQNIYTRSLDLFQSAENAHFNSKKAEEVILGGLKEIFLGKVVYVALIDQENPNLIVKKYITTEDEYFFPYESHTLEKSLIKETIETKNTFVLNNLDDSNFNPVIDGVPNLIAENIICAPLIANEQVLGVISVLNSTSGPFSPSHAKLLSSLSTSLANTLLSLRLIEQLKIANADLEASRWELLNSRNVLRALFDSIPSSIYIVDREYTLIAVNKSRAKRTGQIINLLIGKKCYSTLFGRKEPCVGCRVMETLLTKQSTVSTRRQWVNDNEPYTEWEVSTFPIFDKNGLPIQSIVIEQDVTEKHRLEASLVQSEKLAAVGQLAAGVAHEINNPLAAIIANAQIIQRFLPSDNDLIESAKLIELAGVRASQVVKNLLGFARKEKYDLLPLNVNETIQSALNLLHHEIVTRGVEVSLDLQQDIPDFVGSKDHLHGVWVNMIVNAMDSIETPPGKIRISTKYVNNDFRIIFSDNGKGIPEDSLTRIFEPFYTTKAPGKGTGLGLSVCHRVIKQHGGQIQVESQVGVGTRFIITLPNNKA